MSGDSPSIEYDAFISKQVGKIYKERVFHQTITADAKPCEWLSVAEWEFTPDAGNYLLNGYVYKEKSRHSISNKFFSVLPEPPLKQTQSGISFNEIQCKQNLVLLQKYDGSPACVTESTKLKLIERGWTKDVMDYTNSHPCQKLAFEAFANTTLKRASNTDSDLSVGYGDGENEEFLRSIGCYENRKEWQTQEFLDYLNELLKNKTKFPQ